MCVHTIRIRSFFLLLFIGAVATSEHPNIEIWSFIIDFLFECNMNVLCRLVPLVHFYRHFFFFNVKIINKSSVSYDYRTISSVNAAAASSTITNSRWYFMISAFGFLFFIVCVSCISFRLMCNVHFYGREKKEAFLTAQATVQHSTAQITNDIKDLQMFYFSKRKERELTKATKKIEADANWIETNVHLLWWLD